VLLGGAVADEVQCVDVGVVAAVLDAVVAFIPQFLRQAILIVIRPGDFGRAEEGG
jgi:hypothetical protein